MSVENYPFDETPKMGIFRRAIQVLMAKTMDNRPSAKPEELALLEQLTLDSSMSPKDAVAQLSGIGVSVEEQMPKLLESNEPVIFYLRRSGRDRDYILLGIFPERKGGKASSYNYDLRFDTLEAEDCTDFYKR